VIVDNIVFDLYTKFNDDWSRNEKALVLTTRTLLVAIENPIPGAKTPTQTFVHILANY